MCVLIVVMSKVQEIINEAKELTRLKGWSRVRLASEAGVHKNTLRYLERDDFSCTSTTLSKLETVTKKYLPEKAAT